MSTNAIDISHDIQLAGAEPKLAETIAKAIVTHNSEHLATKADIVRLEGKVSALAAELRVQIKLLMGLVCGLYVGLAILFVDKLAG